MLNMNEKTVEAAVGSVPYRQLGAVDLHRDHVDSTAQTNSDTFLVSFSEPYDKDNPKDWSPAKKWAVTGVLSATGFNRIMVSTIMAPALTTIAYDLHMGHVEANMSLSVFVLASAFGPLLAGPLSEVYGRAPILHVSNVWFLVWNIACGFANSKGLLIASRLLAGLGASAIYALAGGVLGDLWRPEQRGTSLSVYLLIPLLGAAVGPIIGGYLTQGTSWRWMFWTTSIVQAVMIVFSSVIFKETYAPVVLERRAKRLQRGTGNMLYHVAATELHEGRSAAQVVKRSLTRPLRLLAFHPTIQVMSLLSAFYYGLLYLFLTTFANIWITAYHESVATSGLHYLAYAIGSVAGSQIGGPLTDLVYRRLKGRQGLEGVPEYRIPLLLLGAFLAPLGLFLYGWTVRFRAPWPVVDLGVIIVSLGLQLTSSAT